MHERTGWMLFHDQMMLIPKVLHRQMDLGLPMQRSAYITLVSSAKPNNLQVSPLLFPVVKRKKNRVIKLLHFCGLVRPLSWIEILIIKELNTRRKNNKQGSRALGGGHVVYFHTRRICTLALLMAPSTKLNILFMSSFNPFRLYLISAFQCFFPFFCPSYSVSLDPFF